MDTAEFKRMFGLILVCIIVLGICGNTISFLIWTKGRRCRIFAGSVYFIALAVSDTSVLCLSGSYYAVDYAFGINLSDLTELMCKLFRTAWHFTLLVSTYIVVCLTVERVFAVRWPLQAVRWTSRRKSLLILVTLVCVCFLPNLPWTVGSTLLPLQERDPSLNDTATFEQTSKGRKSNVYDSRNTSAFNWTGQRIDTPEKGGRLKCQDTSFSFIYKFEKEWHKWFIDFCMLYSLPLAIITTSNIIILFTICRQNKQIKSRVSRRHVVATESASRAMTARVVAISVVHCASVGPYSIAVLIPEFIENVEKVETISFLYIIFTCIWYVNHSVNFILYSLFGTAFRQDCYDLFCSSSQHRRRSSSKVSCQSGFSGITRTELINISTIYDE